MGLLDWAGDVGGLVEIIFVTLRLVLIGASQFRLKALITNRLYHLSDETKKKHPNIITDSRLVTTRINGDIELDVPMYLDMARAIFGCFCCCCKKKKFSEYRDILKTGHNYLEKELDLVDFIRR